jgi:magnesium-protoporphyrin IX monomethyl ester (oxidative) cyclase
MRICLVNPPQVIPIEWGDPFIFQPLGLGYIAAVLEKQHKVKIIDARAEGWKNVKKLGDRYYLGINYDDIGKEIKAFSPDVVGITVPFSVIAQSAFKVASVVKDIDRDIITTLGGPHPTVRPIECASLPYVDFVVIGEGENTIVELTNALENGNLKLMNIKGIAHKAGGKIVITNPRPFIEDLDSIPFPARHLLPMDIYFEAAKRGLVAHTSGRRKEPWASMITSRGCPYQCTFCSVHLCMGRKYRVRSPENVLEEIDLLIRKYKIRHIDFEDDNLTLDKGRMHQICDLIIQNGYDIELYTPNGVRADRLDEDLLRKMQRAGIKELCIGVESGVQRVVNDIIKKRLDLKKVEEVVRICKRLDIRVWCFFIIGMIGETKEDIKATLRCARKLKKFGANPFFSIATPYYGTELYQQAKELGYIREPLNDESLSPANPLIETPEFTVDELREFYERAKAMSLTPSRANIIKALKHPKKAIRFLCKKIGL